MPFYESVFIIRPDVSSSDVDRITDGFAGIVREQGSNIIKTEYWGIRTLAYEIGNNKKGHYVFWGLEAAPAAIIELERKMKLSEDIIRFSNIKVDVIDSAPSPILKGKSSEDENVVDVTITRDL